jgi:hypothetical protein
MASRINPRITAKGGATRRAMAFLWLAGLDLGLATAEEVPLSKPRPSIWIEPHTFREAAGPDFDSAHVTSAPTECDQRIRAIATIEPMPRLIGPESCGGEDMVRLDAVTRSGGVRIDLKPAPVNHRSAAASSMAPLLAVIAGFMCDAMRSQGDPALCPQRNLARSGAAANLSPDWRGAPVKCDNAHAPEKFSGRILRRLEREMPCSA